MRALLIFNPNSRNADGHTSDEISELLEKAGFDTEFRETYEEADLDTILVGSNDLIVAAGGDGTLRAVMIRAIDRHTPVALLPIGTANNIAHTLDIHGTLEEIIFGLKDPIRRPFDIGCIRTPFGSNYFLEACGFGYFASGLATYHPEEGKSILRSLAAAAQTVTGYNAEECRIALDGEDMSGNYVTFEVMNTKSFGFRFNLAPQANPSDGLLDIVAVQEEGRDNLINYITGLINNEFQELSSVDSKRGRKLEMIWSGTFPLHADAEVIPSVREPENPGLFPVTIEVLPSTFELWLPRMKT